MTTDTCRRPSDKPCECCGEWFFFQTAYLDWGWRENTVFSGLKVDVCRSCGFGRAVPEPSEKEVLFFYKEMYRNPDSTFFFDFEASTSKPDVLADFRSLAQITLASMFTSVRPSDAFLDLGPGAGHSFGEFRRLFKDGELFAIEPNAGAAASYRQRYGAKSFSSVQEMVDQNVVVKVALMSHSLEHFSSSNLHSVISGLKMVLDTEGVLVVEVPNEDLRATKWERQPSTPHLVFFGQSALRSFFERNGWDVLFSGLAGKDLLENSQRPLSSNESRGVLSKLSALVRSRLARSRTLVKVRQVLTLSGQVARGRQEFRYSPDGEVIRMVVRPSRIPPPAK